LCGWGFIVVVVDVFASIFREVFKCVGVLERLLN
jgi:hypothetical protein